MEEKTDKADQKDKGDIVFDLNFVPQWARRPPGENHYKAAKFPEEKRRDRRPPRDRRDSERRTRRAPSGKPPVSRRPARELPVAVSFLPEQKRLASLVRQIHHARRAYPLMDLANLFVQDTDGYLVKIEVDKKSGASDFVLFQCRRCKAVHTSEEGIRQHLLSRHLDDMYEKEEIETEPPSGNFVCVARCRRSGALLAPPNHHSYQDKLNELYQTRFSHLSMDEFKEGIETVHDEELINEWREACRTQTIYKLKSDPEAEGIDLQRAEVAFMREIGSMYEKTQRAIVPSQVARSLEDQDITHAIRKVWAKESQFPLSMSFAMRAAFRHMHLYLFKAGKINFVTHIKPQPVRPEDTVDNIAEVLRFLKENPGSTRQHILEVLHPSLKPDSKEAQEALQPLGWLIERGHIIEFFNGTLSVPLGHRAR